MDPEAVAGKLRALGLRGEVVGRADPAFDATRRVWNGLADRRPAAVVRAADEVDVSSTVRFAAEQGVLLAIRGGGHSLPGLSTCDDGIVLDLRALSRVAVDPVRRQATVGGGALLGDVDRAGAPHGLVVPAGVVSHTGVGGLTLGGGMGWLSRRLGLTLDSLAAARIVLADGRVVDVDDEHEPELFWGIRGGGGNFGVVVRFTFRMHELGPVAIGTWAYDVAEAAAVLARLAEAAADGPRHVTASFVVAGPIVQVTAITSGPTMRPADIDPFGRLGAPIDRSVGQTSFLELQARGDEHLRWGRRVYAKGGFLAGLDGAAIEDIVEAMTTAPSAEAEVYVVQLGGAVADVDPAATAYIGRSAQFYWIAEPVWDDPRDDDVNLAWGRRTAAALAARSMAGNYVNEQGDADASVARQAYGQDTYRRLAELKRVVDPMNVFRLNQNIEPAAAGAAAVMAQP